MKFNKLYENIFKPASPEEVKERKVQSNLIKFKEWMDENSIRYIEDSKGNLVDVIDLEKKDKDGNTPLLITSWNNSTIKIAKLLISKGADVNAKNIYSDTPLHFASRINYLELAKLLISKGADVNAKNNWDEIPLYFASKNNNIDLAKLLLDNRADVNNKNKFGNTPLFYALSKEMKKLLKSHGAKE